MLKPTSLCHRHLFSTPTTKLSFHNSSIKIQLEKYLTPTANHLSDTGTRENTCYTKLTRRNSSASDIWQTNLTNINGGRKKICLDQRNIFDTVLDARRMNHVADSNRV